MNCRSTLKWIALTVCLLLCGCGSEVASWEIDSAIEQCESRGGIDKIDTFFATMARCRNGKWVKLTRGE